MFQLRLDWEKTWIWQNRNLLSSFVHYLLTSSMWCFNFVLIERRLGYDKIEIFSALLFIICWRRLCDFWFIIVLAHVVITLPHHPLPLRATRWFIPEKSLSVSNNVITHSHDLLISRHTCWLIQEKSLTAARIVASPVQQLVIPKIMSVPIQEKNRFIVINATLQAP